MKEFATAAMLVAFASMPTYAGSAGDAGSYRAGARAVDERANAARPKERARNVILFVGDGMGIATVTATRILDGQRKGGPGEDNVLSFERFPFSAFSKTYTTDLQVSESAGTMSAMMTGLKTYGGAISVAPGATAALCADSRVVVPTLLEQAEAAGLATGVVSTARITHATPAATYAHSVDRDWEVDAAMPPEARERGCRDIGRQLIEFSAGDGIEVVLGGGRSAFMSATAADPEDEGTKGGRLDGRDLIAEWRTKNPQGTYVWRTTEFDAVTPKANVRLLGLFERSHMEFEADRANDTGGEPSLAAMTEKGIRILATYKQGYFLMVEGGRIDHGHHAGNAYRALTDGIALADAVAIADKLTSTSDTLIIVTADHSHTLTINGYPARGSPILGKAQNPLGTPMLDAAGRPYTTLQYASGPGAEGASDRQAAGVKRFPHAPTKYTADAVPRTDLSTVDTEAPDYLQQSLVPMSSETHGGEDVPIYARGPGAQLVRGTMEQNEIYHVMRRALERVGKSPQ
jgi:alkaline phosphatase